VIDDVGEGFRTMAALQSVARQTRRLNSLSKVSSNRQTNARWTATISRKPRSRLRCF